MPHDPLPTAAICYVCAMRQALRTARHATDNPARHLAVMRAAAGYLAHADAALCPARFSQPLYDIVRRETGVADPFASLKQRTNALALELRTEVRARVTRSHDPLGKALHAAAAGNVIDAGVASHIDVHQEMRRALDETFAISDLALFQSMLKRGARLLYLADNAGEIVFDALAVDRIQRFGVEVTVAVKSGPIINDATRADAEAAGLPALCPVVETGSADIGVHWERASPALREAYDAADIVLAKGHGHFETLCDAPRPGLFFLLKAKCEVVAHTLGCRAGALVLLHAPRLAALRKAAAGR
jgi:uncharacterized protein with ATP-grasp and redox domains